MDMQRSAEDLVKLYLGERTGEHVLAGRTKRGEGERIHAVIWLCDLRDSTRLSEALPVERFFRSLNEFFDCTAGAVLNQGGEILSYIGDAVFAIFPIGGSERQLAEVCFREEGACAAALAAAWDARSRVRCSKPTAGEEGRATVRVRSRNTRWRRDVRESWSSPAYAIHRHRHGGQRSRALGWHV